MLKTTISLLPDVDRMFVASDGFTQVTVADDDKVTPSRRGTARDRESGAKLTSPNGEKDGKS